jgi:WD40 repeat protein
MPDADFSFVPVKRASLADPAAHWRRAQVLEDHTRPVLSLAVAGDKLFSGSYDYTIRVWSLDSLQRVKTLTGHTDAVRTLAVAGNKLFSGSYDGSVKVCRAFGTEATGHGQAC